MDYMNCPACKEMSVPVGGTECELCDWKAKRAEVEKPNTKKAVRDCLECETEKTIIGRGLCGGCYQRLKKLGLLDEKYPAMRSGRRKVLVVDKPLATKSVADQKPEKIDNKPATVTPISAGPKNKSSIKKPKTNNSTREFTVKFFDRDQRILESLIKSARFNRRPVSQEILFRLEHGLKL